MGRGSSKRDWSVSVVFLQHGGLDVNLSQHFRLCPISKTCEIVRFIFLSSNYLERLCAGGEHLRCEGLDLCGFLISECDFLRKT